MNECCGLIRSSKIIVTWYENTDRISETQNDAERTLNSLLQALILWGRRKKIWTRKTGRGWALTSRHTPLSERLEQAIGIKKISMLANVILSIFLPHALRHLRTSKVFWYHVNIFLKTTFAFEDYENEIFSLLSSARACDSTLFWREDAIAVVILLRVLAKMLSDIRRLESFVILRSREGLTSFNKNNHINFSGEKKKIPGSLCFWRYAKKYFKSNLVSWSTSSSNLKVSNIVEHQPRPQGLLAFQYGGFTFAPWGEWYLKAGRVWGAYVATRKMAIKTSLIKSICVHSNFMAFIWLPQFVKWRRISWSRFLTRLYLPLNRERKIRLRVF